LAPINQIYGSALGQRSLSQDPRTVSPSLHVLAIGFKSLKEDEEG